MGKKLLLIFPRPISEIPMGFAYLSAIAKSVDWDCKAIVNTFNHHYSHNDIIVIALKYSPNIVGINFGTLNLLDTYVLVYKLKSLGFYIIGGGPHATTNPKELLAAGVDLVVRNEGEETLKEILTTWNNHYFSDEELLNIQGISYIPWFSSPSQVVNNPSRPFIKNLEELPEPDFSCFNLDDFRMSNGIIKGMHRIYCSRGCVNLCTYCSNSVFGNHLRLRNIDKVINEIKDKYENQGITSFIIADDTFTANKLYVKYFCDKLKELNLPIMWGCSTRVNTVEERLLTMMKEAGCYLIAFGVESANQETLNKVKKHTTVEQSHNAINLASKLGLRVYVNLMTGFPLETEKEVQETINFIKKHFKQVYIYQVSGSLVPYPGTEIYEYYKNVLNVKNWWLNEDYQNYGIQIHQNSLEPYKVNTYYQRHLFDDTYIWEEKFFKYTREYKNKVKKMVFLVGKRNLKSEVKSPFKRFFIYNLSKLSRLVYEINPNIEKKVVSYLINKYFKKENKFHDNMPLGAIKQEKINAYTND